MSDGRLEKGYNPNLITRKGCFNVSNGYTSRFYWGDGENSFDSEPYFIQDEKVILGHQIVDSVTYPPKGHVSFSQIYLRPLLTISGLYEFMDIKDFRGFFRKNPNILEKIEFLERFLDMSDKSGFEPKDMLVNNKKLRLKLLENHYSHNVDYYSCKFLVIHR